MSTIKFIVKTKEDKQNLTNSSKYIHDLRSIDGNHSDFVNTIMHLYSAPFLIHVDDNLSDTCLAFRQILTQQAEWSDNTFGPGERTEGVIKHIEKELEEIRKDPSDLVEWVDVIQLAFDGARRAGHDIDSILMTYVTKQLENQKRKWPDWRTHPKDEPMEHIR